MKKVQVLGIKTFLLFLPTYVFKHFFTKHPATEGVQITPKTRAIFGSAEALGFLDFPTKTDIGDVSYALQNWDKVEVKEYKDKEEISVSYSAGNRFISWSGLVAFLYTNHWQFVLLLWGIVVYVIGNALGWWSTFCTLPNTLLIC